MRAEAARAVDAVVRHGRSLDAALDRVAPAVDEADRGLLQLLAYGAVRHHWRLQAWIDEIIERPLRKNDAVINALVAVGIYQLTQTRIPEHAAVSATVDAARRLGRPRLSGLVNASLRRFQRDNLAAAEPRSATARYDHPAWMIESISRDWPDDWQTVLEANNGRAPMWLRVNAARSGVADYMSRLAAAGIAGTVRDGLEHAIRLEQAQPAMTLPGFAEGHVSVQDGAAQIAAPWLLSGARGRTLDACAAPGGKSAHLIEVGDGEISLTCLDSVASRADAIRQNLDRLGHDATILVGDASNPDEWWDGKPYDAILLDAPCSATGVIRRHPDIKLLRRADDIDRLRGRQLSILNGLWPLLAPGGRLLYVTCSVLAAENDAVVDAFLRSEQGARENPMLPNNNINDVMRRTARGYQILPGAGGLDGFYYACLERAS